jgi:hypothetical protein
MPPLVWVLNPEERKMGEEYRLEMVDLGDAAVETTQQGPGPVWDSVWVWGRSPGEE